MSISRCMTTLAITAAALATTAAAASASGDAARHGGAPDVEREVSEETYFDEFIFDLCGIATQTTETQRLTIKTYPDGYETVHVNAQWVPDDPRIASERYARTDIFELDGSLTIKGLGVRLYRKGEGTTIVAAGWVNFSEDGVVGRGPHDFLDMDPADLYC
jgi:hypothetical protein